MAATLLADRIATWRRTESRLRTLRVSGTDKRTVAAIARAEHKLNRLAHDLDCSGHLHIVDALRREAALAPMVRGRRDAGVPCRDMADQLARLRARIRDAR